MNGPPWTKQNDDDLRRLWRGGHSDSEIATLIGRSPDGVRVRRSKLGYVKPPHLWTPANDDTLREHHATGKSDGYIAKLMHFNPDTVRYKRIRLGLASTQPWHKLPPSDAAKRAIYYKLRRCLGPDRAYKEVFG